MTTRAITFSNAPGRMRVNHETGVEIRTVRGMYGVCNTYSIWMPNQDKPLGIERVPGDHTLAEARRIATEIVGRMRLVIADAYEAAQAELDADLVQSVKVLTAKRHRSQTGGDPSADLLARLAPPREVCMVPDCGCSGLAHP